MPLPVIIAKRSVALPPETIATPIVDDASISCAINRHVVATGDSCIGVRGLRATQSCRLYAIGSQSVCPSETSLAINSGAVPSGYGSSRVMHSCSFQAAAPQSPCSRD
ncbi:MAG: hypothetical protein DME99_05300 [Verrucomicrobia bacterium]|nr:MAG: hypothetical protein DME99_05300 [Verrucomicrobiota bacterium]